MIKTFIVILLSVSLLAGCATSTGNLNQPRNVKVTVYHNLQGKNLHSSDPLGRDLAGNGILTQARSATTVGHMTLSVTEGRSSALSLSNKDELTLMLAGGNTRQYVQIEVAETNAKPITYTGGGNTLAIPEGMVKKTVNSRVAYKKGESIVFSTPEYIYVLTPEFK